MTGPHLINEDFFLRLSELFEERRKNDHGTIFLTQKRMQFGEIIDASPKPITDDTFPDLHPSKPLPIIIRATNGKSKDRKSQKIRLSTIVEADGLEIFFTKYAEICKLGMSGLKKRVRSKGKKKMKAKKKKKGGTTGVLEEHRKL